MMTAGALDVARWQAEVVPISDERWHTFVARQPDASPFHHPAWARVIGECYGWRPFGLLLRSGAGDVGLPVIAVRHRPGRTRWVSLPYTDSCPPLGGALAGRPDTVGVLDEVRSAAGAARFEIRGPVAGAAAHPGGVSFGHTLALRAEEDEVFATLHRSQVQRNIRRAQRAGVRVRTSTAQTDLTRVFFDLHVRTRQRLGVPVQPHRYFRVLWRRMIAEGLGFVSIASVGDTPVAAAVFLAWGGTIVYKYGASDPSYWNVRANHLLFWEAIRWGCRQGFHTFDFGRTGPADESLRQFKSRWGTVERPLVYTVLADHAPRPPRDEVPEAARAIIRRAPAAVVRGLGTVLYRYTA